MKTLFSLLLILLCATTFAQNMTVSIGGGMNTSNPMFAPFASIGYENKVTFEIGFTTHTTSDVEFPTIFNSRIGYSIDIFEDCQVTPKVGYSRHYRSSDNPKLNEWGTIYSIGISKRILEDVKLYVESFKSKEQYITSIGLTCLF